MTPFLHLLIHYCNHRLPQREAEYNYCVRRNLNHPFVKQVHNLVDPQAKVPDEFRQHPKYIEHLRPGRYLSYRDALKYANEKLPGEIACILNLDIFLDDQGSNWPAAEQAVKSNIVLALSRTEFDGAGNTYRDPAFAGLAFANTQDAWIFLAPFDVPDCDFDIGTLGCDNAIAERMRRTGRLLVNAPQQFKIFHYDRARGKTAANQMQKHAEERTGLENKYPEEQGQYLLPDIDQWKSVDALLAGLKVNDMQRYIVICETLNRFMKISNRPPPANQ